MLSVLINKAGYHLLKLLLVKLMKPSIIAALYQAAKWQRYIVQTQQVSASRKDSYIIYLQGIVHSMCCKTYFRSGVGQK